MAQLICSICPSIQLYIARLEELPALTGGGRTVTARSAAKVCSRLILPISMKRLLITYYLLQAVDWAVSCGVDIISMSWTIQTTAQDNTDMTDLKTAIGRAHSAEILMFCSASDQGANNKEKSYPGGWNQCIRIGGATFTGEKLTWVNNDVDFWFPGRNVPFPSKDGKSVVKESGSSVATAAATGLAGVLIYSARLSNNTSPGERIDFQDRIKMTKAFETMAKGIDGKFPQTQKIMVELFNEKFQQVSGKSNKLNRVNTLEWDKQSKDTLKALLFYIKI